MAASVKDVAENVWLIVISRVAMAVTLPLGYMYIDSSVTKPIAALVERTTKVEAELDDVERRVSVMEAGNARGRQARDAEMDQITGRLVKVEDAMLLLSNSIAALTATIQAQKRSGLQFDRGGGRGG